MEITFRAALEAGTPAPAFSLSSTPEERVALSEVRGRPVIVVFCPADWSPVCGSLHNIGALNFLAIVYADVLLFESRAAVLVKKIKCEPRG